MLDANRSGRGPDIADMHKDPTVSVLWKRDKKKTNQNWVLAGVKHEIFVKARPSFLDQLTAIF